ncbi:type I pullulanase [Niastella koreensis]|uniref:Pullulanase, type I n=2 Tax=Niastella koreensis TaxID=354356 RepID=G8T783_NIAKG|nr:type I pullulanase [Niastella koreensis]AEW00108.1 pullulanase, type I [Niastella koreensis GR20-10]OQP49584.1 type I pullulanase [Niastella koreensis]
MNKSIAMLLMLAILSRSWGQPVYSGAGLGVHYSPAATSFTIWSPAATDVVLRLYAAGEGGSVLNTIHLQKGKAGSWAVSVPGNWENRFYTFQTCINGNWSQECPDLYAQAVGINGRRGMIIDLAKTNPPGWAHDKRPALKNYTDIIIYELHVRDLSISAGSGIVHKGKYLGLTERGTHNAAGLSTGLDHIKELGVTHIHLMPSFDFNSIDEANPGSYYNWGYDPVNYNVPEGTYATDAYDGRVRIRELKQAISTLHANGLRVVLDVVYNHTSNIANSIFTQMAPGYFYRHLANGSYSNGSGCNNETASEQAMMRKFIVESVAMWAREYHVDGFRFDLMGLHDIPTMNAVSDTLHKIDPSIFIYGEGWAAGASPFPEAQRAVKQNVARLNSIAAYSDDIRDGLRGGISNVKENGFASGHTGTAESIKFGIVGATAHPDIDYQRVCDSKAPWAKEPFQAINYVSCHDDNCLFDRLMISNPGASEQDLIKIDKLAAAVVLTSQGVPLLLAGDEMLRTKQGMANSFNAPDSINELNWDRKTTYNKVYEYYRGLIALRKRHPAFRMPTSAMIRQHLTFLQTSGDGLLISYLLTGNANGDPCKNILIVLNGSRNAQKVNLPPGSWIQVLNGEGYKESGIGAVKTGVAEIAGTSANVFLAR